MAHPKRRQSNTRTANEEVTTMQKCLHWQNVQTVVHFMNITAFVLLVVITEENWQ